MRRLTKAERAAAIAVLSAAAATAAAGIGLLRRHARYLAKRAAAHFKDEEDLEIGFEQGIENVFEEEPLQEEPLKEEPEKENSQDEEPAVGGREDE